METYKNQINSILNVSGSPDGNKIKKLDKLYPELYSEVMKYNLKYNIETKESLYLIYHNLPQPYLLFYSFKDGYEYNLIESELIKDIHTYIDMIFLTKSKGLNPNRLRMMNNSLNGDNTYFQSNFKLLYNLCISKYKGFSLPEFFYLIYNNMSKPLCLMCNSETKFINFKEGYQTHCSLKCSQSNPMTKAKQKQTQLDKFGGYAFSTPEGIDKMKKTNLAKYGDTSFSRTKSFRDKSEQTSLLNWGVKNPMHNNLIKEKSKVTQFNLYGNYGFVANPNPEKSRQTCMDIYGANYFLQSDIGKKLYKETLFSNYLNKLIPYLKKNNLIWDSEQKYVGWYNGLEPNVYKAFCTKCNQETTFDLRCRCLKCYPLNSNASLLEKEIVSFIKQNYNGEIITNTKSIIPPLELDIYLPELNLAFEFNGTYWHSTKFKQIDYHSNKTEQALKQGISLIHIWEQSYNRNPDLIKSMILNKLGTLNNKIHARKCKVVTLPQDEVSIFLDMNHIHGNGRSTPSNVSLTYNGEPVIVLTYYKENDIIWIDRLSTKKYYKVNGGFSRLLSKLDSGNRIMSYISRDWSPDYESTSYNKIGFKKIKITPPTLYYSNRYSNKHWFQYQKYKLKTNKFYDEKLTSEEIMELNGFFATYDSGNFLSEYIPK